MKVVYFPTLSLIALYESKYFPSHSTDDRIQARSIAANSLDGLSEEENAEGLSITEESDPEMVAWAEKVRRNIPHVGNTSG
jgi:hypothetical protein